jgi:hypothetical protein
VTDLTRRESLSFWVLLALTAAVRLPIVLADHRSLIATDIYPDDAFYYLQIAANVVAGKGWTFDGLAPTNGFHPLYLAMLLPVMALARGNPVLPIHASGVLLVLWAVATGAVLHALLRRVASRRVADLGLLLWAFSRYFVVMTINGLETGVAVFFVFLVPLLYLTWFCGERPADTKRALAFGAVCGLAVLARVDLLLLLAAVFAHGAWRQRAQGRRALVLGLPAGGAALAVWLPWGLISHAATGRWLPTSGAASREIALNFGWLNLQAIWPQLSQAGRMFDPAHVPPLYHADVATKLGFTFLLENPLLALLRINEPGGVWGDMDRYVPYVLFSLKPALGLVVVLAMIAGAVRWWRRRAGELPGDSAQLRALGGVLAIYLPLFAAGYTFYSPAHWYYNRYLVGAVGLAMVWALAQAARLFSTPERRAAGLVAALTLVACQVPQLHYFRQLSWSAVPASGLLAEWQEIGAKVEPHARLGAFQAGIYGYFGQRQVVNLDGKVNQDALDAIRGRRLHEYVKAQGVRYILEREWMIQVLCARYAPPGTFRYRAVEGAKKGSVQLFEVETP